MLHGISAGTRATLLWLATAGAFAQNLANAPLPQTSAVSVSAPAPQIVSLDQAIALAQANEPGFAAAQAAARSSALGRSIAQSAVLPQVTYHNQFLYTQGARGSTGSGNASATSAATGSNPRFIGNNAVHEYTSQGQVSETIGLAQFTAVSHASAEAAIAEAELEIARRGLVSAVITLYYDELGSQRKLAVAQSALDEANSFTSLTGQREQAREAAHADVVKAQLQQQQRSRDLADAQLAADRARLELAVLLYPDPRTPYTLRDASTPMPPNARQDAESAAMHLNPEIRSAMSSLQASSLDVRTARAAYLPDLSVNFAYGIDATTFAVTGPDGTRNLGYSATATLDIPIWDWLATQHKIRQAQIVRDAAKTSLSATQRRLIADLEEAYAEAQAAWAQLDSLNLSVKTAQESLKLTRLRYTAGESTVLEVVDAENSLTGAELAHEDGTIRYETSLGHLQILTGTIQ